MEEVLRGKALTVIEIAGLALRDYCLLQPDPGQHDVADGLELHRRVGQRGAGVAADLALQAFATLSLGQPYWLELGERTVSVLSRAQRANDTIAVTDRLLVTIDDVDCRSYWRRRTNRAATGRGGLAG